MSQSLLPKSSLLYSKPPLDDVKMRDAWKIMDDVQTIATTLQDEINTINENGPVQTVTDDGNGVVSVNNTDPENPIIEFNGVNVDGVTVTGDGTSGNPLMAVIPTVSDASTTVKGVTKLSVAPVSPTNPIAVGDNDSRMTNARTPTAHAATHVNGTDDIQLASGSQKGLLSSTDWTTFNGKIPKATVATKTADYPLVLTDAWTIIEGNTTTTLKVTVPLNASVAYDVGTEIMFASRSSGKVYLEATGGVTIYSLNNYLGILPSGGVARLTKVGTDTWYFDGDITDSYDADAAAFFAAVVTAGGSFTTNEKTYINTIILNGKAHGWWAKTHYLHLYMGGTVASMKYNVKNPLDTDAAFRLTFVGSPTLNANGCTFNGTTQYINDHYVASVNASQNDKCYAYNWRTIGTNGASFGAISGGFAGDELLISYAGTTYWAMSKADDSFAGPATKQGFWLLNRTTSTACDIRKNDVSLDTDTAATSTNPSVENYIGARNRSGVGAEVFSADNVDFGWRGSSLTSGEATYLYNDCAALQSSLGR